MRIVTSLLIASTLFLSACAEEEKSRYRDTAELEKPPTLAPNLDAPNDEEETSTVKEKDHDGLGDDVYLTADTPAQLKIKRNLKQSWRLLGLALIRSGIPVTDRDSEKGTYTVKFDADTYTDEDANFLESSINLFGSDYEESSYVLTLKEDGAEVAVSAVLESDDGQRGADQDGASVATDGDKILIKSLHHTLRNDLKLEQ